MTRNNPILKTLSNGDVILLVVPTSSRDLVQIIKLSDIKFESGADLTPPEIDWLNFKGEVLYTSMRVHHTQKDLIFGNCLAIREKLNPFLIEKYKKDYMLFSPSENMLSDEEQEYMIKCTS